MGLDMYLNKYPRYKNTTPEMALSIQHYFNYRDQCKDPKSHASQYTMEEWCGIAKDKIPSNDYIDFYSNFYKHKYYFWDTEKKRGFDGIIDEVGYWRKANHIHNWFVENIQGGKDDCDPYVVKKEKLEELLNLCKEVKETAIVENENFAVVNVDEVARLLPTRSGFFFGDTHYDQYYIGDIDYTINIIEKVLAETDFENEVIFYESSW